MLSKDTLRNLVHELDSQIQNLKVVDIEEFRNFKSVFIIKTAYIDQFKSSINMINKVNPNIKFYIVVRPHEKEDVLRFCGCNMEILEYNCDGIYSKQNMDEILNYTRTQNIDAGLILFNTKYGFGYANIEEIMSKLNTGNIYVYNSENKLLHIKNLDFMLENHKLYIDLCNWFWEAMKLNALEE